MTNYEMWKEDTKKLYTIMIDEMTIEEVAYEILVDSTGSYDRCRWCAHNGSCTYQDRTLKLENPGQRALCLDGLQKHLEKEVGGRDGRE